VARIVHYLRLHLVGKKIAKASAIDDSNVFGKVGTSGSEVEKALKGKKVWLPNWINIPRRCLIAG
jgi:formamidopyrimidine-DNA glycosylase